MWYPYWEFRFKHTKCQKYLLLLSQRMKTIRNVLSKQKYTKEQKQKWEEVADSSFSSMSSSSEPYGQRRSPSTFKDHRGRSKSPGVGSKTNRVHPVSSADSGEIMFTASQPTGIIKSGVTCVLEEHVPRTNADGACTIAALGSERNARDLSFGPRSHEMNPNYHTRVPLGRLSAVTAAAHSSAGQDRRSSEASSSQHSSAYEASSLSKQPGRLTPRNSPNKVDQTELVDDSIMRSGSRKGSSVAFRDTYPVGPPPPRSQCIDDHYYVKPSSMRISSEKLQIATMSYRNVYDFDEQLFKGSLYGRSVYVARRVSNKSNFGSEVEILKTLKHPNVVTLRAFCDEDDSQALVFNFVGWNRDLLYNLSSKGLKRETLPWRHRAKLAVELAKGLEYLHKSGIIHRNLTSKNVFVTHDFVPVIGDFCLSSRVEDVRDIILQDRNEDKKARGYLAPEYLLGEKNSEKQDIYAFGVILFELISGRAPFDRGNRPDCYLDKWSRQKIKEFEPSDTVKLLDTMADPRLTSDFCKKEMLGMLSVATLCTREDPKKRPDMTEVLAKLLTGRISDQIARSLEKPARQEKRAAKPGPVRQEKPAAKPERAPSPQNETLGCFGSRSISPVMQQTILISLRNAFGLDPAVPSQQDHGDQSSSPSTSSAALARSTDSGKKKTSEKAPFKGHPGRQARSFRKPRPARPRATDGPTPANARPSQSQTQSPRRSGHGRMPATPFHRLASKAKQGPPQSPGFPMKTKILWYIPKNHRAPRITKENHRVRFAERRRTMWNPY